MSWRELKEGLLRFKIGQPLVFFAIVSYICSEMCRSIIYMVCCAVALLVSCGEVGCGWRAPESVAVTSIEGCARLLFAGDAMCHYPQIDAARQSDGSLDFRGSFAGLKPYFDRADIAVVNLETTISPNNRYSGYPMFASPREYAEALAWVGTDVAMLANNHCCDRRAQGIRSTIATLDGLGVAHTGVFADAEDYERNAVLRIERNGVRFAFVNYTYGTNGMDVPSDCAVNLIDTVRMKADLKRATLDADCVVACMHWGEEYRSQPSREQRRLADFMHRHGVDIVVGSHPHVVQPASSKDGRVTIYSLGNFVSNQRKRYCDGGIIAEVEVVKVADGECGTSLRVTPVWVSLPGYRILPPEVASKELFDAAQRAEYEQFMYDTERLFVGGVN